MNWFEIKVKYQKVDEQGKERKVSEPYLVDAVSFTEAEARITEELKPFLGEEFSILNIKRANYSDLFFYDDGDRWFKSKVAYISIDEEKGVEKKTSAYMLIQANDINEAFANLTNSMKDCMVDYTVQAMQETPIMDVFPYFKDDSSEEIADNLSPVADIEPNADFEKTE